MKLKPSPASPSEAWASAQGRVAPEEAGEPMLSVEADEVMPLPGNEFSDER